MRLGVPDLTRQIEPPTSWKARKLALEYLATDGCVVPKLGDWLEQHHQQSEWYLDAEHNILYHHSNGTWEQHSAYNMERLRFTTLATACDRPVRASHVVEANTRPRFVELTEERKISQRTTIDPPSSSTIHIQHWDLYPGTTKTCAKTSQIYPGTADSRGLGSHNNGEHNHCYIRIGYPWSWIPQLGGRNGRRRHTSSRWRTR
jgi:hypothetical protein